MESESKVQTDYLIVGQGLAGSALALELLARGKTVLVIDDGHKHASSQVAAGLINPITGRRHALCWRFFEFWNSLETYDRWSLELGGKFSHKKPILRFLKSAEERELFEKKLQAGEFEGIKLSYPIQALGVPGCGLKEPCYRLDQAGWVDQAGFIEAVKSHLENLDCIEQGRWMADDCRRTPGLVQWKQFKASTIVFTQGFQGADNPFFRELPFRNAKGEILKLSGPVVEDLPILNRGKWLLPQGNGYFRAGATYDLNNLDLQVTDQGAEEILHGVRELVDWELEVTEYQAGIRPALHDFKPVMGRHPWFPEIAIFNGLGSKGSLMAPLLARELADHLEEGKPLHPEADIDRFRKFL